MKTIRMLGQAVLLLLVVSQAVAKPISLDRIIAQVNQSAITQTDVDREMAYLKKQGNPLAEKEKEPKKIVLDLLINRQLQLDLAAQEGLSISAIDVTKALEDIASREQMSMAQLREAISRKDIDWEIYRKHIQDELVISELRHAQIGASIHVTDKALKAFMKQHDVPVDQKQKAREALYQQTFIKAYEDWLKKLRKRSYVKIV